MRFKQILCLFLILTLFPTAFAQAESFSPPETGVCLVRKTLNLRSAPGTDSKLLTSVPRGALVYPMEPSGDWIKVAYEEFCGWVSGAHIQSMDWTKHDSAVLSMHLRNLQTAPLGLAILIRDDSIYSGPSRSFEPVSAAFLGNTLEIYEIRPDFCLVKTADGYGYLPIESADIVIVSSLTLSEGFSFEPISDAVYARILGCSYPENCPIELDELRYLRIRHLNDEGEICEGELIANAAVAKDLLLIFEALLANGYPLTQARLVDEYDADDYDSMAANNTSCFNYRTVAANDTLSMHAFGLAIDINPQTNPYVRGDYVSPKNGAPYADREKDFPSKIDHESLCYHLFISLGWQWGGNWRYEWDYQHFFKSIHEQSND